MAVLVVVQSSITVCASVSVSYVKRVPGLDGTVSVDVLDVPGYATYQIVLIWTVTASDCGNLDQTESGEWFGGIRLNNL
jgi:hypothetical protein